MVGAEICDGLHSCTIKQVRAYLRPPFSWMTLSITWRIGRVLNENDLQKINRILTLLPENAQFSTHEVRC